MAYQSLFNPTGFLILLSITERSKHLSKPGVDSGSQAKVTLNFYLYL